MGSKFIPNGDSDFATMAGVFSGPVVREPARYGIDPADAEALLAAVTRYKQSLQLARGAATKSARATRDKDDARAEAERLIKRCAAIIRLREDLSPTELMVVGMKPPATRKCRQTCPQEPPRLRFVRGVHEQGAASPVHELSFGAIDGRGHAKPDGAARLELYMALIPVDAPIPGGPSNRYGEHAWHLGAFARSPFKVEPLMASEPMLVVYWGRWAATNNDLGPWSKTVVARIEGAPAYVWRGLPHGTRQVTPLIEGANAAPVKRESTYSVAVRDARYEYPSPQTPTGELPPPPTDDAARQIEGPPEREAA